jgi:uncharacterized protein involved in type VI secretion and phage assembly
LYDGQTYGVVIGVVCDLEDPLGLGRVRVEYPDLDEQRSHWARLITPMAGPRRGAFFRPEVKDEVAVIFERGEIRNPLVLGGLWNQPDPPPPDDGKPKENNWRFVRSRSGHVLRFDDTNGKERVEVIDKDGSRKVVLDTAGRKVQVICEAGDIEVKAGGNGSVTVEAATISIKASRSLTIEAGTSVTIKGATVAIN